jgi:serine/threonine protein kinase
LKIRSENQIWQWDFLEELVYIAKKLINFVIKMSEFDVYHTDIKPGNIILTYSDNLIEKDKLKIKLIDFGGSSTSWEEVKAYTKEFYPDLDKIVLFSYNS